MKPWMLLLLVGLSIAWAEEVELESAKEAPSCSNKCTASFTPHTNEFEEGNREVKSCQTGCRYYQLIDGVQFGPFAKDATTSSEGCKGSCDTSFASGPERDACKEGCSLQAPISKDRKDELSDIFEEESPDDIFGGLQFPSMDIQFGRGGFSRVDEMFSQMRQQMGEMVQRMLGGDGVGLSLPEGGQGRMVVIKSGPGYREEKTVDFGPDGVQTRTKTMGNDMMAQPNPFEIRPLNPDAEIFDRDSSPIFGIDILPPPPFTKINTDGKQSNSVRGFDFDRMNNGYRDQMCAQKSENMKWSDWVSCLHQRMGLPRWLTAAVLSLGIIFIIWLCLVIPHSAPKQRLRQRSLEAAKLEKEDLANLNMAPSYYKLDLPPSYEDIANLHVAVPLDQAGPLPEKKELVEEKKEEKKENPDVSGGHI